VEDARELRAVAQPPEERLAFAIAVDRAPELGEQLGQVRRGLRQHSPQAIALDGAGDRRRSVDLGGVSRVARGDLGQSYFLDRPVLTAIAERAEPTLVLTFSALFVAVIIGVPAGVVAAAHPGSVWDRVLMLGALLGVCIPGFWLGLNFIYLFAVHLGWLPAAGYTSPFVDPIATARYMILPAVSLGINQSALIARITRSQLAGALNVLLVQLAGTNRQSR
jgi:ABC-type microcin C transport system permease subunit YejB